MENTGSGTKKRPLKVDEASFDRLTIARMTDHNVRGETAEETKPGGAPQAAQGTESDEALEFPITAQKIGHTVIGPSPVHTMNVSEDEEDFDPLADELEDPSQDAA